MSRSCMSPTRVVSLAIVALLAAACGVLPDKRDDVGEARRDEGKGPCVNAESPGCPAQVRGRVGSNTPSAFRSAIFAARPVIEGGATRTRITGFAVSFEDGCDVVAEMEERTNDRIVEHEAALRAADGDFDARQQADEDNTRAFVADWQELFPAFMWSLVIGLTVDDASDVAGRFVDFNAPSTASHQAFAHVCNTGGHPSFEEDFDGELVFREYEDCFVAVGGDVEVESYAPDSALAVNSVSELATFDDEEGVIEGTEQDAFLVMEAQHCPAWEAALVRRDELLAEQQ